MQIGIPGRKIGEECMRLLCTVLASFCESLISSKKEEKKKKMKGEDRCPEGLLVDKSQACQGYEKLGKCVMSRFVLGVPPRITLPGMRCDPWPGARVCPRGSSLSAVWGQANGAGAGRDLCSLAPHPLRTCPSSHWSTQAGTSSSNIFTRAGSSGASAATSRSLGFPQK